MKRLLIFPISLLLIAFSTVAVTSCSSEESGPGLTVNDCTWLVHNPYCWNDSALKCSPRFFCKLQNPSAGQKPQYSMEIVRNSTKLWSKGRIYLEDISVGYIFDFEDFQVTIERLPPENKFSTMEGSAWWATSGEVKVIGKVKDGNNLTFTLQFSNLVLRPNKSSLTDLTVNGIVEFKYDSERG